MKNPCLLLSCLFLPLFLAAQTPQAFNFQAIARDQSLKPVSNATLDIEVQILRDGTPVFTETHTGVKTAATGLFVLQVGTQSPSAFANIDWRMGNFSLKVSTSGDLDLEIPPSDILSVPYAFVANEVLNERQQLEISGNTLTITGGNSVQLPAGGNYSAGPGIGISGSTISNLGDRDSTNDITTTTQAGGDVSGIFSALSVDKIKGQTLSGSTPQAGQVLKWNGNAWTPDNDLNTVGSGNTATSAPVIGDGSAGNPVRLSPGTAAGQVLKWNGSTWAPAADDTGTGTIGGDVSGPLSNLQLNPGVVGLTELGSMGATQTGQVLKWNNTTKQWELGIDLTVGGTAGGDVSGTFTDLTVNRIKNRPIDATAPVSGQVLKWNGSAWAPANDLTGTGGNGDTYNAGTGIGIAGTSPNFTINNTGDINAGDDVLLTTLATGDVSGTFGTSLSVDRIKGRPISASAPSANQVLKWNGSTWAPADDLTGGSGGNNYSAGTGIIFSGTPPNLTINNTGDANAGDDVLKTDNFGGDVSGVYNNLQIANGAVTATELADNAVTANKISNGAVTAAKLAQMGATNNQVLKWNGSAWGPANETASPWLTDANGIYYPNSGNGTVRVNTSAGAKLVGMGAGDKMIPSLPLSSTTGVLATYDQAGKDKAVLWHVGGSPTYGAISVFGPNGATGYPPVTFYANPFTSGGGDMYISNSTGTQAGIRVATGVWPGTDAGYIRLNNSAGNPGFEGGIYNNAGYLLLGNNITQSSMISMGPNTNNDGTGIIEVFNASGKSNVSIAHLDGYPNNGYIGVRDASGTARAGATVDETGQGLIFGDNAVAVVKNFRVDHPRDTTKEIWYACIEGPEAAMYERGTAMLKNGEAWVPFSEHFGSMLADNTLTVTLTPNHANTYGLAVIEKTPAGIRVKELKGGQGSFSFDWEVKGVRKGYESYQPVRPKKPWPRSPKGNQTRGYGN